MELNYWDPLLGWRGLYSDFAGGYLRNSWYKLRIEKNGENYVDYYLNRTGVGMLDFATSGKIDAAFSNLAVIEWRSNTNPDPIVCPMFFWDDHSIGLS